MGDANIVIILGLLLNLIALGVLILRRSGTSNSGGVDTSHVRELEELEKKNAALEHNLNVVRQDCSKYSALAGERLQNLDRLQAHIQTEAEEKNNLANEVAMLKTRLEDELKNAQEKIDMLTELRKTMEDKFGELARIALKEQGEEFSKANIEKITATLQPYKEHVGFIEKELNQIHIGAVKDRAALKNQIELLSKDSQELAQALKTDHKKQGAWGELVLERILQNSGLREGSEYEIQAHRKGEEGQNLRPDVVVKLSKDKTLVIDSKVSLTAYTEAGKAETESERNAAIKRHVKSVMKHIDDLSGKSYQSLENRTVDYVILFLPYENALAATLNEKTDITSYAYERNIMIATPTTLMMALRTVAHVWSSERRNQNAEEIASRAGKLYDKVSNFIKSFEKAGEKIDQAQSMFENARGQLSRGTGNVIAQVQSLKRLGAKTTKSIETVYEEEDEGELTISPAPTEKLK